MPRKRLSEYRAKTIIANALDLEYTGYAIDAEAPVEKQLKSISATEHFAVKVDQGIKGRHKKGLVLLDVSKPGLPAAIRQLAKKGYRSLIIEPMVPHEAQSERYLSL